MIAATAPWRDSAVDEMSIEERIVRLAHECFCAELLEEGWRPGPAIDFEAKTHTALKAYDELTALQKERLREAVALPDCDVVYALSHAGAIALKTPPLCLADMRVGREVHDGCNEDEPDAVGRITDWKVADEATGRLATITVQWPDGSVVEYDGADDRIFPVEWPEDE
jgi:hypothetical protein